MMGVVCKLTGKRIAQKLEGHPCLCVFPEIECCLRDMDATRDAKSRDTKDLGED
jgi:hypothetical protein